MVRVPGGSAEEPDPTDEHQGTRAVRVATENGYADQSHLHRDVLTLTGTTPTTGRRAMARGGCHRVGGMTFVHIRHRGDPCGPRISRVGPHATESIAPAREGTRAAGGRSGRGVRRLLDPPTARQSPRSAGHTTRHHVGLRSRMAIGTQAPPTVPYRVGSPTHREFDETTGQHVMPRPRPDGVRSPFRLAAREPEFRDVVDATRSASAEIAHRHLPDAIPEGPWRNWAAQLIPNLALEAVIAWLDACRSDPDRAAEFVERATDGVIQAIRDT